MAQAKNIIAFPISRAPAEADAVDWDNTLLFEVLELSRHLRKTVAAIECRIQELKIRSGAQRCPQ